MILQNETSKTQTNKIAYTLKTERCQNVHRMKSEKQFNIFSFYKKIRRLRKNTPPCVFVQSFFFLILFVESNSRNILFKLLYTAVKCH
jgi:hypothetical protein